MKITSEDLKQEIINIIQDSDSHFNFAKRPVSGYVGENQFFYFNLSLYKERLLEFSKYVVKPKDDTPKNIVKEFFFDSLIKCIESDGLLSRLKYSKYSFWKRLKFLFFKK